MSKPTSVEITFNGVTTTIPRDEQGRLSINALHEASGKAGHQRPADWTALERTKNIARIVQERNPGTPVLESKRGRYGGTFANLTLALSYAQWVSDEFHVAVCEVMGELVTRGYVVADRWYNVADIVRMYRRRNGDAYSDHMEPLEGHNDIGYYAEGTTEEQYRKAREIGRVRLERLSKREWSHPDKYHFVKEGADPGGNGDGPCNSWCASRYYFVRVDEVYNLIDVLFGDEIGHFAPEWRHREEEMLSGLPRYRRASLDDPFLAHQLSLNLHKPPLITWDSWADALNSDEDMPA